eukprot:15460093-Alexandrium_andersonii.AAC.1
MDEMIMLMGVDPARVAAWPEVINKAAMGQIIGNAAPVPLLVRIFARMLPAAGLTEDIADPFEITER